jgi:ubiquitin-fold modifier 1
VILTFLSERIKRNHFLRISVPEEAPFSSCIKFVAEEFKVNPATSAVITNSGVGINPS